MDWHERQHPVVRVVLGVLLLALGLAGLVLPIIPGVAFIVAALLVFGILEKRHIRQAVRWWRRTLRKWRRDQHQIL